MRTGLPVRFFFVRESNVQSVTVSNKAKIKSQHMDEARSVLDRWYASRWDQRLVLDLNRDTRVLTFLGECPPSFWDGRATVGPEQLMAQLAPFLDEPWHIQTVGRTGLNFPLEVLSWLVFPGDPVIRISQINDDGLVSIRRGTGMDDLRDVLEVH